MQRPAATIDNAPNFVPAARTLPPSARRCRQRTAAAGSAASRRGRRTGAIHPGDRRGWDALGHLARTRATVAGASTARTRRIALPVRPAAFPETFDV
jgi:hypothetical protein